MRAPFPPDADARARFERLYEEWHLRVLGYLARRTVPPGEAADVLAEVFLTAWRRIDQVPPGEGAGPWLFGVARRCLANHHRGGQRRERLGHRLAAELDRFAPAADAAGEGADVRAALRRLPAQDQELLTLIAWEGLDPAGAAAALGISAGAARVRLHRARRRLRLALAEPQAPAPEQAPEQFRSTTLHPVIALQEDAR